MLNDLIPRLTESLPAWLRPLRAGIRRCEELEKQRVRMRRYYRKKKHRTG